MPRHKQNCIFLILKAIHYTKSRKFKLFYESFQVVQNSFFQVWKTGKHLLNRVIGLFLFLFQSPRSSSGLSFLRCSDYLLRKFIEFSAVNEYWLGSFMIQTYLLVTFRKLLNCLLQTWILAPVTRKFVGGRVVKNEKQRNPGMFNTLTITVF